MNNLKFFSFFVGLLQNNAGGGGGGGGMKTTANHKTKNANWVRISLCHVTFGSLCGLRP